MENLPTHVAVIPDGNRRWAKEHGKPGFEGHIEGAKRFREISRAAFEMGVPHFTFWAASADNLRRRSPAEVQVLVSLFRHEIEKKSTLENCLRNKIQFRVIGNWFEILHDTRLLRTIQALQDQTKVCNQYFLTILFGYNGMEETLSAVNRVCQHCLKHIDEQTLRRALWTRDLPPVDLVIRTGTERPNWTHVSSGILNPWLTPNAQIFSPQILWPDFTAGMFRRTIEDYSKTPRRFGA